jgi:hemerythrin superfamily protein/ElaB/YqjD/DUF883 family membrane-anchored ribosome-binding protein
VDSKSDIYTRLKHDHETVASILQQLLEMQTGAANTAKRQALFSELKNNLIQHSEAENEVFYAALLQHNETRDLIRDGQNEHQRIETQLDDLDRLEKDDALWGARLHALKGIIEHHVHEEEEKVFPRAKKILTVQRAEELGRQFAQAKARHKPMTAATATSYAPEATAKVQETGQRITQEAQRLTEAAKEKGSSILHDQQHFFASQLGGVAAALHKTARQLGEEDQGGMAQYVDQAATGLERFSQSLRERNLSSLVGQVEDFARQQPVAFIGTAALVGFLAARFLKSSSERRYPAYHHPSSAPEGSIIRPYTDAMAPAYAATASTPGSKAPAAVPASDTPVGVAPQHDRPGTPRPYGGN